MSDEAAKTLARYLGQLKEAGEDEIYVSADVARTLRSGLAEPCGEARAITRAEAPVAQAKPAAVSRPGVSPEMAERLSELPEVEVVPVELALGQGAATTDMFSERFGLDDCTTLAEVETIALKCERCELAGGRTNVVFGAGNPDAVLMFVGEAPGANEDAEGIPFVGRAGQLLNKILDAAEIRRDDVYIGNIIKCRPPNNRTPFTNEIAACVPYLAKQIDLIRPKVICTLGLPATQTLLGMKGSMRSLRGKIYKQDDVKVIPTYHPAAALRDPKYKRPLWEDFLLIKRECMTLD